MSHALLGWIDVLPFSLSEAADREFFLRVVLYEEELRGLKNGSPSSLPDRLFAEWRLQNDDR